MKMILFICVRNEARSQMAEAFLNRMAYTRNLDVRARSAGIDPGEEIDPNVRQVMGEAGYPLERQFPKPLSQTMLDAAHVIVTLGCGVEAALCPFRFAVSEDWCFDDPKGRPLEEVRQIRDGIRAKVEALLQVLTVESLVGDAR